MTAATVETKPPAYSLEVLPPRHEGGPYQWAIRHRGKLIQRSDRPHATEDKARRDGMGMIERLEAGHTGF